jgi:hypothetical protein
MADRDHDGSDGYPGGYMPVSRLAVAAVALGAVSALAVVSPVFWVLPLIGIAVAAAALADIGRPGAPKVGRLLALAGLGLAVGFGAQAVAAKLTAGSIARGRAEAAARLWLDTIAAERLDDARSMCVAEAAEAIAAVAACRPTVPATVQGAALGESADVWVVRAQAGACAVEITVASTPAVWQGRPGERWMVSKAEVIKADAIRPSAN